MTKFNKIIMNPPYSGNLHLKILREAMKHVEKEGGEIVNLSPIRWLQDPLAEYKKGSDWKKFADVMARIESLEVISAKEATNRFDAAFTMDLGIYTINEKGGFDRDTIIDPFAKKLAATFVKDFNDGRYGNIRKADESKEYKLYLPKIHGHIGEKDFTEITSKRYETALAVKAGYLRKCVSFDSEKERRYFYDSLFTNFYKYVISHFRTNINVTEYLDYMPFLPTYKKPWTDADLYEYFDLTPEEIKEIENAIR